MLFSRVRSRRPSVVARSLAWIALVCVACAALLALGCDHPIAPPLIDVTEVAPREVEPGDRLEVHGAGFPQGRTGHVKLSGTVSRGGEPQEHVRLDLDGTVVTPDRLEIVVREPFAERLCGYGDRAAHATFRGDVEVSFTSSVPGAPPLVGLMRGAALDMLPSSPRATVLEARAAEGGRLLDYLGLVPGASTPRGLPIEHVAPGSVAEREGFQVGDVIVSVDGLHVLSLADLLPVSARSTEVGVRHGDSGAEETKTIALHTYTNERVPAEYTPALVIVGLALAILVFLVLPGPSSIAALELRLASRLRRTSPRGLLVGLFGRGRHAVVSIMVSAVVGALALTPWVVGRETDGVLLLLAAGAMLVWSRAAEARGFVERSKTLLRGSVSLLVMAAATALAIAQVGAIELAELVRIQGGAPWHYHAARHPSCAILALAYLAAIVQVLCVRTNAPGLLERAGTLFAAALAVIVFFGGWQLPSGGGASVIKVALFLVKTWGLTAALLVVSRTTPSHRPADLPRLAVRRLVPMLLLGAGFVAASRKLVPGANVETAIAATLVALAVLFGIRLAARVHAAVVRPEPRVSPL